jgi:hypothetical protein
MRKKTWKCSICGYANDEQDETCQSWGSLREEPCFLTDENSEYLGYPSSVLQDEEDTEDT